MKLSFGNMTVDLNIFNLGKQPLNPSDQPFKINLIEEISSEHLEENIDSEHLYLKSTEEYDEVEQWFDEIIPQDNFISTISWAETFEPLDEALNLGDNNEKEKPPKLELKTLPDNLKYAYLGEDETLPVIIAADLTNNQQEALLEILKQNKEAIC